MNVVATTMATTMIKINTNRIDAVAVDKQKPSWRDPIVIGWYK